MKTTPIYILLLIFFLNFYLAWGLTPTTIKVPYLLQTQYSLSEIDKSNFHSLNVVYFLNSNKIYNQNENNVLLFTHRIKLNLGLSKVLAEVDYEMGLRIATFRKFYIMPYISTGTNIYSFAYGGGIDLKYITKGRFVIVGNLNYRTTEILFGHTDAQQWYQRGFGAKIGVEFFLLITKAYIRSEIRQDNDFDDY